MWQDYTAEELHGFWFSGDDARQQHGDGLHREQDQNQVAHQLHPSLQQNYYNLHLSQTEKY